MEPQLKVVEQISKPPKDTNHKKNYLPYLLAIGVVVSGLFMLTKAFKVEKEDDVVDEFVSKKELKNASFKNLDVYSPLHTTKVVVSGSTNIYGSLITQDSDYKDVNVYGSLGLKNTNTQDMNIYGSATMENFKGRDIEVYGKLIMTQATLSGDLFVASDSKITNTDLQALETMGTELVFDKVSIKKIKVSNPEKKKVTFHLRNTKIDSISFDDLKGDVILYGDKSSVASIKGGVVIKKALEQFPQDVPQLQQGIKKK